MAEQSHESRAELEHSIFGDEFLLSRPLLRAVRHAGPRPVVLLIDEVDRADEEFEAFLLEVLSDFQVTVPEIGTFTAKQPPFVILTSNRTRELNDALKRRCLYLWIDYPSPAKERDIVLRKVPGIEARLAEQIVGIMHTLRAVDFYKRPGIAETLDWSRALVGLRVSEIGATTLEETAGCLLKYHDDIQRLQSIGAGNVLEGNVETAGRRRRRGSDRQARAGRAARAGAGVLPPAPSSRIRRDVGPHHRRVPRARSRAASSTATSSGWRCARTW